jgi:hypothetical protein
MSNYFTRLTPNIKNWKKPSGTEGKCIGTDLLYEDINGFGWEEWLLEDYHEGNELCLGFLQAFNNKNNEVTFVDVIHFYTRICDGVKPKQYYVGYIKNVKILPQNQRAASENIKKKRLDELKDVGVSNFPTNDSKWENCFNIQFEHKNVFLQEHPMECEITLNRGQFRFALYDLNNHPNFLIQINNYL